MNKGDSSSNLTGKIVWVRRCQAQAHGDNRGCVCDLIGQQVVLGNLYQPRANVAVYHIRGSDKVVLASGVEIDPS